MDEKKVEEQRRGEERGFTRGDELDTHVLICLSVCEVNRYIKSHHDLFHL